MEQVALPSTKKSKPPSFNSADPGRDNNSSRRQEQEQEDDLRL
jgi:hypothetical protein